VDTCKRTHSSKRTQSIKRTYSSKRKQSWWTPRPRTRRPRSPREEIALFPGARGWGTSGFLSRNTVVTVVAAFDAAAAVLAL
jgi:hypothetical protein